MTLSKPAAHLLRPADFHIMDALRGELDETGDLHIPGDYRDFVMYGPYWRMAAGTFMVKPVFSSDIAADSYGAVEVCDMGTVVAEAPLTRETIVAAHLPDLEGMEIRIRSAGIPFVLHTVVLTHAPDAQTDDAPRDKTTARQLIDTVDDFLAAVDQPSADRSQLADQRRTLTATRPSFDRLASAIHRRASAEVAGALAPSLDFGDGLEAWLTAKPAVKVIDVWDQHLLANAFVLSDLGFDLAALRLTASDRPRVSAQYAHDAGLSAVEAKLNAEPSIEYDLSNGQQWHPELRRVQGGFSKLAAASGAAYVTCPFTGAVISSRHSLLIANPSQKQVFIFYRFDSVEPFYIVSGGFSGSKMYCFVPGKNVVLRLHSPLFEWGGPEDAIRQFYRLILPRSVRVIEYWNAPTETAIVSGTLDNVGHFFWNEMTGVLNFADGHYIDDVRHGLLYSKAYIDPYALLPDTLIPNRMEFRTEAELLEAALDKRLFCVRPAGAQITDSQSERLRAIAIDRASASQRISATEARACDFVLWAGIRSHNKVWINQVDGIISVVNELAARYGAVALFVDGTPDCQRQLDEIRARAPSNVTVYDGINISIYDTLMWAFLIDAYIATIGSGLTFVTWVAGKMGVAHSETHHLGQMSFWADVRPSAPMPLTPDITDIVDIGVGGYCDYAIEPDVILRLFRQLPVS